MDWSNLQGEKRYDGFEAYARSKLAVILFTYALARRLEGTGVTANCLHPGVIKTKLLRAGFGDYPGDTPENGARTSVYLASSPEVEGISGRYFEKCKPVQILSHKLRPYAARETLADQHRVDRVGDEVQSHDDLN